MMSVYTLILTESTFQTNPVHAERLSSAFLNTPRKPRFSVLKSVIRLAISILANVVSILIGIACRQHTPVPPNGDRKGSFQKRYCDPSLSLEQCRNIIHMQGL